MFISIQEITKNINIKKANNKSKSFLSNNILLEKNISLKNLLL